MRQLHVYVAFVPDAIPKCKTPFSTQCKIHYALVCVHGAEFWQKTLKLFNFYQQNTISNSIRLQNQCFSKTCFISEQWASEPDNLPYIDGLSVHFLPVNQVFEKLGKHVLTISRGSEMIQKTQKHKK